MKKASNILSFILLISINTNAQDSLQNSLNKFKNLTAKSTTLVLISNQSGEQFGSINNSKSLSNYDKYSSFYIGSVSKVFTAISILKLCEQNKISLNSQLSKFAFSKKLNKNIPLTITIQNLLQHTSGIADFTLKTIDKNNPEENLNTLPLINSNLNYSADYILSTLIDKLDFHNGKKCSYSNSNYFILAQIIEEIMDMPYSEAIRTLIISPLQLKNTFPYLSKNIPNLIHSFDDYGNDIAELNLINLNKVYQGSGNIISSLNDLNLLFKSLLIDKIILSDSTLKKMTLFINDKENGFEIGLGLLKINQLSISYIGHQGDILANQIDIFFNEKSKIIFSLITTELDQKTKDEILKTITYECKKYVVKFQNN